MQYAHSRKTQSSSAGIPPGNSRMCMRVGHDLQWEWQYVHLWQNVHLWQHVQLIIYYYYLFFFLFFFYFGHR